MPVFKNISCSINTDFGPIQEFPCVEDNLNPTVPTSTVYIPVRDGQTFSINFNVLAPSQHLSTICSLCFIPSIDGMSEVGQICSLGCKNGAISGTQVKNSHGIWELCKFVFSSVHFTEDRGADVLTLDKVNKLGEIVVTVRRYQVQGPSKPRGESSSGFLEGPSVIHEKSIKGKDLSHSVSRAKGVPIKAPQSACGTYLDTEKSPYMVFRFLYRSESALKSIGLLETGHSPSPPPPNLQIERNPSFTKPKAETKHVGQKLKQEREGLRPSFVPSRNKVSKTENIETIDMTGDD